QGSDSKDREAVFDLLTGALPYLADKMGLSSVHLLFPDRDTANEFVVRDWALRLGLQFQFKNRPYRSFDDFLGSFRAKRRANIRRECREIESRGITAQLHSGSSIKKRDARLASVLYLPTVDKHVWGRRYLTPAFFERVMHTMPDSLHFVVAKGASGGVLGGAFNLIGKDALYGRYW